MLNKRHRWARLYEDRNIKRKLKSGRKITFKICAVKKCIHCGLFKGHGRWGELVYFNEKDEWLSTGRLPYACLGENNSFFFTKEDFKI